MYYYGNGYAYSGTGQPYYGGYNNGVGGWWSVILVVFLLLIVLGAIWCRPIGGY